MPIGPSSTPSCSRCGSGDLPNRWATRGIWTRIATLGDRSEGRPLRTIAAVQRPGTSEDDALVRRARTGDVAAFEALVASRLDRCYRLAWSILSNEADAADAMQDALLAAWRQVPRLRDPAAFDGWLNRVVANAARMALRRRSRRREVQVRPVEPGDLDGPPATTRGDLAAQADLDRIADADAIGRAFGRLRPEDRVVLALYYVDERSVAEIAATLAVPVGTAKWRLHEARRSLERTLGSEA
jgi:RNA polymerase sigma-70 factor, ECF subfamily